MSKRTGPPSLTGAAKRAIAPAETPTGLASALKAFEVIGAASTIDAVLRGGRNALPTTEAMAKDRALRILEVLETAGAALPERIAVLRLVQPARSGIPETLVWHVAPMFAVRIGKGPLLEAVADPFLRHAPLSVTEWMHQLQTDSVSYLFPDVLRAEQARALQSDAGLVAPDTLKEQRNTDVTTQRGGNGTEADGHGLAQLLRAWLRNPGDDPAQVARFRTLFGETAWRALVRAYPKLIQETEAELKRRSGG